MKKMLFIGAMLIVGMTAFAGRGVVIGTGTGTASGDATLGIKTVGEVVDEANNVLLVVKPTISAGDDGTSLHFKFKDIKSGTGKSVEGEFTVEVLSNGQAVSIVKDGGDSALEVELVGGNSGQNGGTSVSTTLNKLVTNAGETAAPIGTLTYNLNGSEENNKKLYRGRVTSNVVITDGETGSFRDDAAQLTIKVTDLKIN